jgi:hypothetical protein
MSKHPGVVEKVIILHINVLAHSADAVKNVLWHWGQEVLRYLLISVHVAVTWFPD